MKLIVILQLTGPAPSHLSMLGNGSVVALTIRTEPWGPDMVLGVKSVIEEMRVAAVLLDGVSREYLLSSERLRSLRELLQDSAGGPEALDAKILRI